MSIDLYVDLPHSVSLQPLLPKAGAVLAEMLGLDTIPELTLHALENGRREKVENDELRDRTSPFFLISMLGEPETVGLTVPGERVSLIMSAQRTNLEYALGAAIAIALARELGGGPIGDDWRHYGDNLQSSPEDLLRRLKVVGHGHDYREAAEQLSDRLGWETA